MPISEYIEIMARAATTSDVFNAVAEPRRRQLIELLGSGERSVGQLADALGVAQPQASKHLRVLKDVGVVQVREEGQLRLYRLNGAALRPLHEWSSQFERFWNESFGRLDDLLERMKQREKEKK